MTEMTVSLGAAGLGLGGVGGGPGAPAAPTQAGRDGRGRAGPAGLLAAAAGPRTLDPEAAGNRAGGLGGGGFDCTRDGAPHAQKNALKPWQKQCWCISPQAHAAFVHNMEDVPGSARNRSTTVARWSAWTKAASSW